MFSYALSILEERQVDQINMKIPSPLKISWKNLNICMDFGDVHGDLSRYLHAFLICSIAKGFVLELRSY